MSISQTDYQKGYYQKGFISGSFRLLNSYFQTHSWYHLTALTSATVLWTFYFERRQKPPFVGFYRKETPLQVSFLKTFWLNWDTIKGLHHKWFSNSFTNLSSEGYRPNLWLIFNSGESEQKVSEEYDCSQKQTVARDYRYCFLNSSQFPAVIYKEILGNMANQSVCKIVTADNSRRFSKYFAVFPFGEWHFVKYMITCKILQ